MNVAWDTFGRLGFAAEDGFGSRTDITLVSEKIFIFLVRRVLVEGCSVSIAGVVRGDCERLSRVEKVEEVGLDAVIGGGERLGRFSVAVLASAGSPFLLFALPPGCFILLVSFKSPLICLHCSSAGLQCFFQTLG